MQFELPTPFLCTLNKVETLQKDAPGFVFNVYHSVYYNLASALLELVHTSSQIFKKCVSQLSTIIKNEFIQTCN